MVSTIVAGRRSSFALSHSTSRRVTKLVQSKSVEAQRGARISLDNWEDALKTGKLCATEKDVEGQKRGYKSLVQEGAYYIDDIVGDIPEELIGGILWRNGPGLFEIGNSKLDQPFDGDGMICKFYFESKDEVKFQNKYVRTKGYEEEQNAGRMLYKGAFATGNPSGRWFCNPFDFTLKNVANTGILQWCGKLFALWEGGMPHELNVDTLSTVYKETDWEGRFSDPLAAHYRVITDDSGEERLVGFGTKYDGNGNEGPNAKIVISELNRDGDLKARHAVTLPNAGFGFFHDILVTRNYYILIENPIRINMGKLLFQYPFARCSIAQTLEYRSDKKALVHLIPREDGVGNYKIKDVITIPTAPFFSFHHVNAFELDDHLVIDSVAWRSINFSATLETLTTDFYNNIGADSQRSEFIRLVLHPKQKKCISKKRICRRAVEFPLVSNKAQGQPYKHAFFAASSVDGPNSWGPLQAIMRVSFEANSSLEDVLASNCSGDMWIAESQQFPGEPIFVPSKSHREEGDGYLLSLVYDSQLHLSELVILNAKDLRAGPVATLKLKHHVPFGLHGSWSPKDALVKFTR